MASDADLFRLDELDDGDDTVGHSDALRPSFHLGAAPSFTAPRRTVPDDLMELDEAGGAEWEAREGASRLAPLVDREAQQLRRQGPASALVAQQCAWLLVADADQDRTLERVAALGPLCEAAVRDVRARTGLGASGDHERTAQLLEGEAATWALLYATLLDLRAFGDRVGDASEALWRAARDEWTSDEQFFLLLARDDVSMRRWRRVVAWLERLELSRVREGEGVRNEHYWEYTQRAIARGARFENAHDTQRPLVTSLDVDAPLQEAGALKLHSMDQSLDERLMKRVWELVRCGQVGAAVAECNGCQQQWRSAVLLGMQFFHDPKIDVKDDPADARGNCDPHLLRTVCLGLATNPQCSVYERAVYGLFAGRLESILAVSQRYHDHLWAHCKVNLLRRFLSMRSEDAVPQPVLRDEDIFATIDAVPELAESSRLSFVRVQRMIILGQINELVEYLGELLERADCPAGVRRFAAHALLVLSRVRAPSFNPYPHLLVPAAQAAVESYVDKVLAPLNRPAVVVAMCAQLDDEQRYNCVARFISNSITAFVGDDADKRQQRRLLYIEACEAGGMDTTRVLRKVVMSLLPPPPLAVREVKADHFGEHWLGGNSVQHTTSHMALVEVLGWLTLRAEHWHESVVMANQIARQFVLDQRIVLLRHVIAALPHLTLDRCRQACASGADFALEMEFWRTLASAYGAFGEWTGARPLGDSATLQALYEGAEEALRRVLSFPERPLFPPASSAAMDDLRDAQLRTIRRAVVPQVFLMLHHMHHCMARYDLCMALADDVVHHDVWPLFVEADGSRPLLQRFLALLRDSAVAAFHAGHRDFLAFDAVLGRGGSARSMV